MDASAKPESKAWIGVDLDGTLARSDTLISLAKIGAPIPRMMDLVKSLISDGRRVKIFTARASDPEQIDLIRSWLKENSLPDLEITNIKDYDMIRLYDDRAIQVVPNTGELVSNLKE
ncbi:MAG: hypothetical protein V1793_02440 [Pseudomonadota bacterium]